jgi:methylated-DNA-[protein]-cysteine S-methyltransferase
MNDIGYFLFETPVGTCGIAWRGAKVIATQLPERDAAATGARLERRVAGAVPMEPPDFVRRAVAAIVALTEGAREDLRAIPIDLSGVGDFERRVYEVALGIMPGETLTYGAVAAKIGEPGAARAVGKALGLNPLPIIVPCHRVLAADGKTGGFSANGGVETKLKLLTIEKAKTDDAPSLFDHLPLAARPAARTARGARSGS